MIARLAAILGAALMLLWPALLNGYPLLFVDTASYLQHTITGVVPWDKTAAYGPFLAVFHQGVSLWLSIFGQALILSWLLWLVQAAALGQARPGAHLLLVAGLSALTSVAWFVAMPMPDFFTPVVVLCLYLLGLSEARFGRATQAMVALTGATAIAAHLSHLPTACALVVLVLLLRRRLAPALRAAVPVVAAVAFLLAANGLAFGRVTLSEHGSVFLLARLQDDGPATWTLRARCPDAGWHLCGFLDRLPMNSDLFLWTPESPVNRDAAGNHRQTGSELLAPEAREIIAATLRDWPLAVLAGSLRNGFVQQFKAEVGDTFDGTDLGAFPARFIGPAFSPAEVAAFQAGAQWRGLLAARAAPFLWPHLPVLVASAALCLAGWWRLAKSGDTQRLHLLLCLLVGISANALVAGALSRPHHRYEARIIWLLPLGAAIAFWPRRVTPGQAIGVHATPRG